VHHDKDRVSKQAREEVVINEPGFREEIERIIKDEGLEVPVSP
jgi:hypothetical protein